MYLILTFFKRKIIRQVIFLPSSWRHLRRRNLIGRHHQSQVLRRSGLRAPPRLPPQIDWPFGVGARVGYLCLAVWRRVWPAAGAALNFVRFRTRCTKSSAKISAAPPGTTKKWLVTMIPIAYWRIQLVWRGRHSMEAALLIQKPWLRSSTLLTWISKRRAQRMGLLGVSNDTESTPKLHFEPITIRSLVFEMKWTWMQESFRKQGSWVQNPAQ